MNIINPETLKLLRKKKGLTLDALAETSKISRSTISRIERRSTTSQNRHTIESLAKAVGCEPEKLASPPDQVNNQGSRFDRRSAPGLKMSDPAQNALHLVATRYRVGPEEILDLAPLLFDLAAMESLLERRDNLKLLDERWAALEALSGAFIPIAR